MNVAVVGPTSAAAVIADQTASVMARPEHKPVDLLERLDMERYRITADDAQTIAEAELLDDLTDAT